ncbi:MAG: hypothetical protein V7K41_13240 [Nostoc sp.]|uniref:hypothetical protein n=1 Tax=Nostoc sp. TaxID=1180 RepID=UPI002FF9A4A8
MIDFEPWDRLLRQYVERQGRVNYIAWKTEQPQAIALVKRLSSWQTILLIVKKDRRTSDRIGINSTKQTDNSFKIS